MERMKRKIVVFFILCAVILGASWSLLQPGMFKIHDFIHGVRITEMHRALVEGQVPVRWTEHFGYGYGMPLYEFYAPLPYYVGTFFYSLGIPLVTSVKLLFLLSTVGTAFGAYLLGRSLFSRRSAGILIAAAFTLAPYRALNLFVRGALSETWGMMALPWIFYGIVASKEDRWRGFYAVLFGCVVLVASHNLTALIAAPFIVIFTLGLLLSDLLTRKGELSEVLKRIGALSGAAVLSLGVTAFYAVPAFLEKSFTQIESTILSGYFDFSLHFLYIRQFFASAWGYGGSEWGPYDPISFYLGFGQISTMFFTVGLFGWYVIQSVRKKKTMQLLTEKKFLLTVTVLVIVAGALGMSLQHSIAIWRTIEVLSYIQFPWRYLSIASLGLAIITAVPLLFIRDRVARLYVLCMYLILQISTVAYFRPEEFYADASGLYYDDPGRVATHMSEILPDYIPLGMNATASEAPSFAVRCLPEDCALIPIVERGHERLYSFQTPPSTITSVEFAIADYPGWTVFADTQTIRHHQSEIGTIVADIPAGTQRIGVQLKGTQVRNISDVVSFISIVTVALLYMFQHRKSFLRKELV